MREPSWPVPTWTNARWPAVYMASTSWRKRTGSRRWRMKSSRTAFSSEGYGEAVVPDHRGTVGGWRRKRFVASSIGAR
jgi:hypothetical protein